MGVEKFYTVFKAGMSSFANSPVYAAGFGFGGSVGIRERHKINIDASTSSILYNNNLPIDKTNLLNKIDLNYKFELSPRLSLLLGPSVNIYVAEDAALNVPYTIYSAESSGTHTSIWIGANAGVSYRF